MSEEQTRLKKLIEHWIEHNDEHTARFEEKAKEVNELGLSDVAKNLKAAAQSGEEVSKYLSKAVDSL
jgi:acyl CoA:acetate/3-ketoacid CoA transferase alpha subunit